MESVYLIIYLLLNNKIKRGYKRNFIKSIVEYKENQIEEIKTGNLGEER